MMILMVLVTFLAAPSQEAALAPDAWVHEGDSDGDGLTDAFELAHGLDPKKISSFADGVSDENRLDASGKSMWELQQMEAAAPAAPSPASGSGGGTCGLTGWEGVLLSGLAWALRRRRGQVDEVLSM